MKSVYYRLGTVGDGKCCHKASKNRTSSHLWINIKSKKTEEKTLSFFSNCEKKKKNPNALNNMFIKKKKIKSTIDLLTLHTQPFHKYRLITTT